MDRVTRLLCLQKQSLSLILQYNLLVQVFNIGTYTKHVDTLLPTLTKAHNSVTLFRIEISFSR